MGKAAVGSRSYSHRGSLDVNLAGVVLKSWLQAHSAVMAQILDPLPPDQSSTLLCCYVNATSKIQIGRISNIPNWYFERVVFPGQRLVFEAPPHSLLEIHTGMMATAILSDNIPCERLCIHEDSSSSDETDQKTLEEASDNKTTQKQENLTAAVLTFVD